GRGGFLPREPVAMTTEAEPASTEPPSALSRRRTVDDCARQTTAVKEAGMDYDDYQDLLFERREHGVLQITINRPEQMNATDERLHSELARVWRDVDVDGATRAVVKTGSGRAFSAGGDLGMVERMAGDYGRVAAMAKEAAD